MPTIITQLAPHC